MSLPNKLDCFLYGEAGVGKTSWIDKIPKQDMMHCICVDYTCEEDLRKIFESNEFNDLLTKLTNEHGKNNVQVVLDEMASDSKIYVVECPNPKN